VAALDFWALVTRDSVLREKLFEVARRADPESWRDRFRHTDSWNDPDRLNAIAREVDFARQSPQLLAALSQRLRLRKGDAPSLLRQALLYHPRDFWLAIELGHSSQDREEQAGAFLAAVALRPQSDVAYYSLGVIRYQQGRLDEAAACYRKAIELNPRHAGAHNNLGLVLNEQKRLPEAIELYRRAIEIDDATAHIHSNLASALYELRELDEAVDCARRAIEIDPNYAPAHVNLGVFLRAQGKLDDATASFRRALKIQPDNAMALCNLGHTLNKQGKLQEGLEALRKGHAFGSRQEGWTHPSAEWVKETEQFIALEAKLPAVLAGENAPETADENLGFAQLCLLHKRRFAAAARFFAAAFAADPRLAQNPGAGDRYNAACAAALAADGQGIDADQLTSDERAALRRQSLDWLRADLAAMADLLERKPETNAAAGLAALAHWQTDPDLGSVRDERFLAKLPPDEQSAWRSLWADVEALRTGAQQLNRAGGP
jgi:tetratricopeptide (TPR) repeat protein